MQSKSTYQESMQYIEHNSHADARERNRIMMNQKSHNQYVLVGVYMGRRAPYREKVLKILSRQRGGVATVAKLFAMSSYSNPTQFRTSVLRRLQELGFVRYDRIARKVKLTRLGWLVVRHTSL